LWDGNVDREEDVGDTNACDVLENKARAAAMAAIGAVMVEVGNERKRFSHF
jgi:hypothetical protein